MAFALVAEAIGWKADSVYQVGVGNYHEEIDVLVEEYPEIKVFGCDPCPVDKTYQGEFHQVAISNYVGEAPFYLKHRHRDGSSLHKLPDAQLRKEIVAKVTTLDALWPDPVGKHILLWLDCESSELAALQGGENFIKRVEMINVEMTAKPNGPGWVRPVDIHRHLLERGFIRQWIHTFRIPDAQMDCIYVRNFLFKPEYCCDPIGYPLL